MSSASELANDRRPPFISHRVGAHHRRRTAADREGEPGFLKRNDGFDAVRAKAETFAGTYHPKPLIAAVVRSLPDLTPAESKVLAEAVDIIPGAGYAEPTAGLLYARNRVYAERCCLALATVKSAKRGLEQKGYAVRHAAGDNNAAQLDIRPFLADIDRHIERRMAIEAARHEADHEGDSFKTIKIMGNIPGGSGASTPIQSSKLNFLLPRSASH